MKAMKHLTSVALFALASLVTVGSAAAQNHIIRATIPFNFSAGNKLMPAGTYSISSQNQLNISIYNSKQSVMLLSRAPGHDNKSQESKLVFDKHGDQLFLRKIVFADPHILLELPISKTEKKVLSEHAGLVRSNQVFLALNR